MKTTITIPVETHSVRTPTNNRVGEVQVQDEHRKKSFFYGYGLKADIIINTDKGAISVNIRDIAQAFIDSNTYKEMFK